MPKNTKSRAQWVEKIWAAHTQSVGAHRQYIAAVLKVRQTLISAKQALPHGEFTKMLQRDLPFDASNAQRLMATAGDQPDTGHIPDINIKVPLIFMFVDDKDEVNCHLYPILGYELYPRLMCDLGRHVARCFERDEKDVFERMEKERHNSPSTISGKINWGSDDFS